MGRVIYYRQHQVTSCLWLNIFRRCFLKLTWLTCISIPIAILSVWWRRRGCGFLSMEGLASAGQVHVCPGGRVAANLGRKTICGSFLKLTTRWDQSLCAFSLNLPCIVIFSFNKPSKYFVFRNRSDFNKNMAQNLQVKLIWTVLVDLNCWFCLNDQYFFEIDVLSFKIHRFCYLCRQNGHVYFLLVEFLHL